MTDALWVLGLAAFCAVCLIPLVIRVGTLGRDQIASPQHVHVQPTSRLGGAIVFLAYSFSLLSMTAFHLAPSLAILTLLACALPVFLAGISEDITGRVSPKQRLAAASVSAILASVFAGGVIARLDLPYVDGWLTYELFALLLTCFMVMGACNAFNLIDGANGLVGGAALLMFAGLAVVAAHAGDRLVFVQAVTMIGALAGFLYWNYPRARVFMGDGGAYFVGFIYAELSIQIVARNEHVSAWFVIMLAAYPIVETLYSIYRRVIVLRSPSTQPDALHLHSLVFHRVTLPAEKGRAEANLVLANALATPTLWLHGSICFTLAVILHDDTGALIAGILGYLIFYVLHYHTLWKHRKKHKDGALLGFPDRRHGAPSRITIPPTGAGQDLSRPLVEDSSDLN
jgi:UDP-N-acetylmuramyl pentapeptide phosphotransferase/UDP-N-acetylglucosamine-1-phosphate transferase